MIDEDYFKYREANLLAQWDKKLATVLKIQELEAELKEFSYIQTCRKDKNTASYARLERSIEGFRNRIARLKKTTLYDLIIIFNKAVLVH